MKGKMINRQFPLTSKGRGLGLQGLDELYYILGSSFRNLRKSLFFSRFTECCPQALSQDVLASYHTKAFSKFKKWTQAPVNEIYPLEALRIHTFNSPGFWFVYKIVIVVRIAFLAVSEQDFIFSYFKESCGTYTQWSITQPLKIIHLNQF